jgi:hypothetical protein
LAWITRKTVGDVGAGKEGILSSGFVRFGRGALVPALGWPLALASGMGLVLALARRTRADVILVVYAITFLALASRAGVINDRYALPLVPAALLLSARLVEAALLGTGRMFRLRPAPAAVPVLTLALCAPVALDLVETNYVMTRADTRVDAKTWFEANVPSNERVVIDMLRFWNTASPPLAENRERLLVRLEEVKGGLSGGGHSSVYEEYYRYQLENPRTPAYYLVSTRMGHDTRTLMEYREAGFHWAVVSDRVARGIRGQEADSSGSEFYRALRVEGELMAEFSPERWRRRGPCIWIYRF